VSNGNNKNTFAIFGLLFGAASWGAIWYPYRIMAEAGVAGAASSFYTYAIALLLGSALFAKHWRGMFTQPKSILWLSLVAGWTNLSYVMAVIDGEVMRVMLLFYLSPVWTLLLAHFWLKEKTRFAGHIAIAASVLGAFIMLFDAKISSFPMPRNVSEWLALSAGMGFALSNVITRKSDHLSIRAKSFAVWLGVVVMSLLVMPFLGGHVTAPSFFTATNWAMMASVGLLLVLVTLSVQYGVSQISATRASVIFLFELVVAAVASYYLAQEAMTWNEWLGGSLIIAAALIASFNHADD
jgi:drug/metabolite transporter (DMT)-like permease